MQVVAQRPRVVLLTLGIPLVVLLIVYALPWPQHAAGTLRLFTQHDACASLHSVSGSNITPVHAPPAEAAPAAAEVPANNTFCPDAAFWADQMRQHFSFWPDGFVTQELITKTYYTAASTSVDVRLQLIDGKLYFRSHPRGWHYETRNPAMLWLAHTAVDMLTSAGLQLPDVDYMWGATDVCHPTRTGTESRDTPGFWAAPVFSVCDSPQSQTVPIPDYGFWNWRESGNDKERYMSWPDLMEGILNVSRAVPYASRIRRALFRGDMRNLDRASAQPFLFNHTNVDLGGVPGQPRTNIRDFPKWAIQIYMAGNGYSSRMRYLLSTGSPVVYLTGTVRGLMHEYYIPMLQPWVHYIPVWHPKHMLEVIDYLLKHPDVAETIGRNGQAFALEHLTLKSVACYMYYTWRAYAAKTTGQVRRMDGSFALGREESTVYDQYVRATRLAKELAAGANHSDAIVKNVKPGDGFVSYTGPP